MVQQSKYTMKLDMRVLEHLGIKLYSNAAAVLSELVANSWDAEATEVSITFGNDKITITDNGIGMTCAEINQRFLIVGYDKRKAEGGKSAILNRPFMGRKGIGKLSVFSIACCIDIYSAAKSEKNGLRLELSAIQDAIKSDQVYHPLELSYRSTLPSAGTTIELTYLKKSRVGTTASALRKRLARRFAIIGRVGVNGDKFDVSINEEPIGPKDRDDLKAIEYLWEFGNGEIIPIAEMSKLKKRFLIPDNRAGSNQNWVVNGWFGASIKPSDLDKDPDAGNLRSLVVISRGRLIQENILDKLGFNGVFGSYLTGQIHADFLDLDDAEDIATSDRQRLMEDDERVTALLAFLRKAIVDAAETWGDLRRKARSEEVETQQPVLKEWIEGLPTAQQIAARNMMGLIQELDIDAARESDRITLFRSGVLAFERLRLREASHNFENLKSLSAEQLLNLLATQDDLEASLYRDIIAARIDAIKQFKNLTDDNEKEKVLQKHLFDHLWLLDASWERATEGQVIEQNLKRDFPKEFADDLTTKEKTGRVDIKYRTAAGTHIIVELKRYLVSVSVNELEEQGRKYRSALFKLLSKQGESNPKIRIVFVLGKPPKEEQDLSLPKDYAEQKLDLLDSSISYYDSLISNAISAYQAYFDASAKRDKIEAVLKQLS
jgi:hypothetical protein